MRISIIAAVAENGVIGRGGALPWRLSSDLKRFKRLTMGHHLLVGRKTFESLERPLPGRSLVVISRGRPRLPHGVLAAESLAEAIELARSSGDREAFVGGGSEIFAGALELADRLYLTRVQAEVPGDAFFPDFPLPGWRKVSSDELDADGRNDFPTSFEIWERR